MKLNFETLYTVSWKIRTLAELLYDQFTLISDNRTITQLIHRLPLEN